MRLRGFWGTFVAIAGKMTVLVIVITTLVFLLIGIAGTLAGEGPFGEWLVIMSIILPVIVLFDVGFGLVFGFLMAFAHKASTISINFQNRDTFLPRLTTAINELGFRPESQSQNTFIYKGTGLREKLYNPLISVQIEQTSATIVGPAVYVRKLQRKVQ